MQIPGYKILGTLGKGGMATVYLAIQESFDRKVAIKVMSAQLTEDPAFGERFQREARIVSQMKHPNIVTVYDIGVVDNHYYLAMEYVEGKELRNCFGEMSLVAKIKAVKDIAAALNYAGNKGCVHRDVKPENVMLCDEDGRAILMDFGIAKTADTNHSMTKTGMTIGTPYYMSPEQAQGKPVDKRSDIYSLGILFFQLLTGHVPYDAESEVAIGIKHITAPIPFLPAHLQLFQAVIDKVMAKDPEERYQNGAELIADLDKFTAAELDEADRLAQTAQSESLAAMVAAEVPAPAIFDEAIPPSAKKVSAVALLVGVLAIELLAAAAWYLFRPKQVETQAVHTLSPAVVVPTPLPATSVNPVPASNPAPVADKPAPASNPATVTVPTPVSAAPVANTPAPPPVEAASADKEKQEAALKAQEEQARIAKEKQEAEARAAELKQQEEEQAKAAEFKKQEEERAEKERLAKEQADREKAEKEKAEKERQQAALLAQQKQQREQARQQELQQEINARLDQAAQFREQGQLVTPPGSNALDAYRDVLIADPGNAKAAQGVKDIESSYLADIRHLIETGNTKEADNRLRAAAQLFPNDASVDALLASRQQKTTAPVQAPVAAPATVQASAETKVVAGSPQISKLVISETAFDTMPSASKTTVPLDWIAYAGFSYQDFDGATSLVQAVLYDSSHTVKIIQKPIVVTGAQGDVFFTLARPAEGFPDGGYILELRLNDQKITSLAFTVKH